MALSGDKVIVKMDDSGGTYEQSEASLLVFVASMFLEPVDWVLTGVNIGDQPRTIYRFGIEGFAAKQYSSDEVSADLFMTAVLHPEDDKDEIYKILTVQNPNDLPIDSEEFFDCDESPEKCSNYVVKWRDENKNARDLRDYMYNRLFRELFDGGI